MLLEDMLLFEYTVFILVQLTCRSVNITFYVMPAPCTINALQSEPVTVKTALGAILWPDSAYVQKEKSTMATSSRLERLHTLQ